MTALSERLRKKIKAWEMTSSSRCFMSIEVEFLDEILAALDGAEKAREDAIRQCAAVCEEMTRYYCAAADGNYGAGMEAGDGDYIHEEDTVRAILALLPAPKAAP